MLEFKGVSKSFAGPDGEVAALRDVSFSMAAGEFLVARGPSGCGKTTLLLVAGALLSPDSGEVQIDGQVPYALPPNRRSALRAAKIGFVFQQFHLIPYLTVTDNILACSVARPRAQACDRARELISRFGLEHRRNHVPAQLSSGECQRTALARALFNEPGLILADEPTGNLDEENTRVVLQYLAEFAEKGGAVLIGSHSKEALRYAHRSFRLDYGRLEAESAST